MEQATRRRYLIQSLLNENPRTAKFAIPESKQAQEKMLRALVNTRLARPITPEFEKIQDEYLTELLAQKKVTKLTELTPIAKQIYLWQGDITTLAVEAIVNAANQMMLGCYRPNCNCIDNAIHTFAGIQLRNECYAVMKNVGRFVKVGQVLPTKAYNLPSNYVLHVAGPYVKNGELTPEHEQLLKAAYQNCLKLAADNDLKSLAFCCISTGEFHFPNERAAQIAVETVTDFLAQTDSELQIVFNVFKDEDQQIYHDLLTAQ